MNIDQMRRLLCERMCADVTVEERPDGDVMIVSPFRYPDGDGYPIHLSHPDNGVGVRLSDRGHTLMYISYEHDVDSFTEGNQRVAIEKILTEHGITFGAGAFMVDTQPDQIPDALFRLGQGITGVCNLATAPRAKVNDEFYRKLEGCVFHFADKGMCMVEKDYTPLEPGNANAYSVDFLLSRDGGRPLYLYGVPTGAKARLTTIMLYYFHQQQLMFESIIVYRDQATIPRLDVARLTDVGGEGVSSLASTGDLERKLRSKLVPV